MKIIDIRRSAELEARLRFETLLSDLTARFVNLASADVDGEIGAALQHLCEGLGLDRSTLWEFPTDDAPTGAQKTHGYQISEALPVPHVADAASFFPWTNACMSRGEEVMFTRWDELPPEAARDRENYRMYGTRSVVVLPLRAAGKTIGILTFAAIRRERTWTDHTLRRFRLCAQVFAAVIDRRRSDMALHESEERLRLATDAAGAGLWNLEIETMQFWGSPQLRELLGFAPGAELTYELFLDTIYAPDREAVRRSVQHASRDGALFAVDFRVGVPNGNFRWIAVRGRRGRRPNHGSMIGLCVDATERKVTEEALGDLSRRLISAHEQERARLARELHDDLTQRLAILSIELGRTDSDTDGAAAAETARSVGAGLARLSEDVHALSYRLHPTVLEDLGLVAGLQGECDRLARQESLVVDVRAHEVPDAIPRDVALCLFRVLQESLRNVVRHANASGVEVSLRELDGGLQLAVCDDGVGFLPAGRHAHGHLGLASMHERLHLVGGELDLDSAPGKGTTVVAWVPLQRVST